MILDSPFCPEFAFAGTVGGVSVLDVHALDEDVAGVHAPLAYDGGGAWQRDVDLYGVKVGVIDQHDIRESGGVCALRWVGVGGCAFWRASLH